MIATIRKLESNDAIFGVTCIALATIGLSFKAILIKLVYEVDPQIDPVTILLLRFVIALPFFVVLLYYSAQKQQINTLTIRDLTAFFLLGAVGFYVSAILDFTALAYIPAGLERLILFMYPTFVVIISLIVRPKEISKTTIVAMLVSYSGIIVVFIEQAPKLTPDMILGACLVFAAAITFAIYTVISVKQIKQHGSIQFTAYATIAATIATAIHAIPIHGIAVFNQTAEVYALIFPMAIFCTVLPLIFMAEGINRIGAASASIINTSGPVFTLAMAFVILGESFGMLQALGGAMIIGGIFLVAKQKR